MRADRVHGIVDGFRTPLRLAFNAIERSRMHHGHYRAGPGIHTGDRLWRLGRARTKRTIPRLRALLLVIAYDAPGARIGVFAQFHVSLGKQSRGAASIEDQHHPAATLRGL